MKLSFTKMHGLGNDFVVFNFTKQVYPLSKAQAARIADRHFGIGCDQILIVEKATQAGVDFKYRILNADGSEVGQCGNGSRCFARFVHQQGLSDKNPLTVETLGGQLSLNINDDETVTVNMGVPNFQPDLIPLAVDKRQESYQVMLGEQKVEFAALSIGNPHAVILVPDINTFEVAKIGSQLESHDLFPEHANIGFMQIINKHNFALRVFERGVGETIACGSGACAAAVSGIQQGLLENAVTAQLSGGKLKLAWQGEGQPVMMTGPSETVFSGEIELT